MRVFSLCALLVLASLASAAEINTQGFNPADDFNLRTTDDSLSISWNSPEGQSYIEFQIIPQQGNNAAGPLIKGY